MATGSWSVAAAQGYADGEALPLADALRTAEQIVGAVDVPVTVEGVDAKLLDPRSTWGVLEGNPTQEIIRHNGALLPLDF